MARIRSVHPDALKSDKLAACTAEAERCYWRLQPMCDDDGRAEDDPVLLAATMFPKREDILGATLDLWLDELAERGLIVRYEVDGGRYLVVVRWHDYQKPQKKVESRLPPLPEDYATPTRPLREGCSTEVGGGVGEGVGEVEGEENPLPISSPRASTRAPITAEEELAVGVVLTEYVNLREARAANVGNPSAWRASVFKSASTDHTERVLRWLGEFDVTPRDMACALIDGTTAPPHWDHSRKVSA